MLKVAEQKISIEEYFELCETAEEKYEYWDGKVIKMPDSSSAHVWAARAIFIALLLKTKSGRYNVFYENVRVELDAPKAFFFPDVVVTTETLPIKGVARLKIPILIVEVLSPSTAKFDKTTKKDAYFALNSLYYYVLAEQERRFVTLFTKDENGVWNEQNFEESGELFFEKLSVSLTLDEIYEDVSF